MRICSVKTNLVSSVEHHILTHRHEQTELTLAAIFYRDVCGHSQTKANFSFSCDSFWRRVVNIRKLFPSRVGIDKMAAYANKF